VCVYRYSTTCAEERKARKKRVIEEEEHEIKDVYRRSMKMKT